MNTMGRGQAFGAVTILNATATGHGCSLAIDAPTVATWNWEGRGLAWPGGMDDRLVRSVWSMMQSRLGRSDGAAVTCTSRLPTARGLKTSSAAATAMIRAATDAADAPPAQPLDLSHIAIQAARDAGVTLTGAYDDQVAVERGGCHLTDNPNQSIIQTVATDAWHVAVWVPAHCLPKEQVATVDATIIAPAICAAEALLLAGDLPGAMSANGAAFTRLYRQHGLPVDKRAAQAAMAHGALGAGLSGTGPAVAALFSATLPMPELPTVPGGVWHHFRAVAEAML
jgi:shikimate kinase